MKYSMLTPREQQYLLQDDIRREDIEAVSDIWTIIDYLTPLYRRFSKEWYILIARLTEEMKEK